MTNKDILESIISLLAVDGTINKYEMQFFKDVCTRLECSKGTLKAVLEKARQGKGRVHLPEDEADKKRLLYFLVQAVVADGKICSEERKILDRVIDKMGMAEIDVERFLQARLKEIKAERYTSSSKRESITCPKCGHEQTAAYRCKRCGIIFEKYKQVTAPSDFDKLRDLLTSSNIVREKDE